jgi:hypothetical protein
MQQDTQYCMCTEFKSEFPFPKLGGTCKIIYSIRLLLRTVSHSSEVTEESQPYVRSYQAMNTLKSKGF